AVSEEPALNLEGMVGKPASLRAITGYQWVTHGGLRQWTGIVSYMEQVQGIHPQLGEKPLSTYFLRIVPNLWLLTQRRNHRIYQHLSIPDIVDKLLKEWSVEPVWKIERARYPKLEYKVQYGESDYAFMS